MRMPSSLIDIKKNKIKFFKTFLWDFKKLLLLLHFKLKKKNHKKIQQK